jgi:hypothetical protein
MLHELHKMNIPESRLQDFMQAVSELTASTAPVQESVTNDSDM